MGWRYLLFTLGGITLVLWAIRFFAFSLEESPRYLVGRGRDEEAVSVIHRIAAFNGRTSSLTVEQLNAVGERATAKEGSHGKKILSDSSVWTTYHIKSLFKTARLAWSTSLLIFLWGMLVSDWYTVILTAIRYHRPCFYIVQ